MFESEKKELDPSWDAFREKYKLHLDPQIPIQQSKIDSKKINGAVYKEQKHESKAKIIQRWWRERRQTDTLIPVNPRGIHSDEFHYVLNHQKIRKSINLSKQAQLLEALEHDLNWQSAIFQDPHLPYLATSLYAAARISLQQYASILERLQVLEVFKEISATYPILDEELNFTKEARNFLLRALNNCRYFNSLSEKALETFRLLIAKLPKLEQVFYLSKNVSEINGQGQLRFSYALSFVEAVLRCNKYILHMSRGVKDALGIARFGVTEYNRRYSAVWCD